MTFDDRVRAIARFGFTERQARFLVHVLLFGGMCLPRQYARFAGTAYGHNVTAFFARLVERGHARACGCLHNRGRLYHVDDRRLYEATGEPRSRYRRPVPAGQVIARLARLDGLFAHPNVRWLITDAEKVAFINKQVASFPPERLPHVWMGGGATRRLRLFPNDVFMGIDEEYRPVFVYVVTTPSDDDRREICQRYGDLLAALPRWTLRFCFPPHLAYGMGHTHVLFHDELAELLSPKTVDALRWYFEQLRSRSVVQNYPDGLRSVPDGSRFHRAEIAFAAPRFRMLYQRWLNDGDAAFDVISSHRIVEHLANDTGRVRCMKLPVAYGHLSPVVGRGRTAPEGVEHGVGQGAERSARPQPPALDFDLADPAGCARDWQRLVEHRSRRQCNDLPPWTRDAPGGVLCRPGRCSGDWYTPGTQT